MLTISRFHVPGLFLAMLLCIELGRRLRRRATAAHTDVPGAAAMQSAVFALFGLLLAFTFSGAMGRYDTHRQLIVQEANAINTAYLRLDLLPADAQPALRQTFRDYTLLRERTLLSHTGAIDAANQTGNLQKKIWNDVFAAVISLTIYTTLDIEDPTSGLVTLSENQAFNDLLQTMH